MQAIQYVDEFAEHDEALSALMGFAAIQEGFIGGRVLHPTPARGPMYRLQIFFAADGIDADTTLPDDCRLVTILDGQRTTLGIKES